LRNLRDSWLSPTNYLFVVDVLDPNEMKNTI
jgi:hypothetical protein